MTSPRFLPGIADFSYCLNKWRYRSMTDMQILDELQSVGAKCFQLDFLFDHDGGEANRRAVRDAAQAAGIALTGADYGSPSPARLDQQIRAAKELGITIVRHALGPFLGLQEPMSLTKLKAHLSEAARRYSDAGLLYALENHQDYPSKILRDLLGEISSPALGVFLDTGNSLALAEVPMETARLLAPWVFGVHVKEYAVLPAPAGFDLVGVPLGEGIIDNRAILAYLVGHAPQGTFPVLLENPIERCRIPILSDQYRRHLGHLTLGEFGPLADLMRASQALYPNGVTLVFEDAALIPAAAQDAERSHNRSAYSKMLTLL